MRSLSAAVVAMLSVLPVAPLGAQTTASSAQTGQHLVADASAGIGYDDDVYAQVSSTPGLPGQSNGGYNFLGLGLAYSAIGRRTTFGASADSSFRFYRVDDSFTAHSYGGSVGVSTEVTRRMRVSGTVYSQRSSHHIFWMFPVLGETSLGQTTLPSLDYTLTATDGHAVDADANVTYRVTARGSVIAGYGRGYSRFDTDEIDRERWNARYEYGFSRYATLRLGYGREDAEYLGASNYSRRTIDAGIDYSRPLSFSRKTTLNFRVGSSGLDDGVNTTYTVIGNVNLSHQLSRYWALHAGYDRSIGFVGGFLDPFLANSVNANATGTMGRRVELSASGGYSDGNIGFTAPTTDNGYVTYTAGGRVQILLARNFSAYGEYVYYHYKFEDDVNLAFRTPPMLDRRGVRGGLNYTVAVF